MQHPEWWNLMSIFLGLAALVLPPLGGVLLARKGRRWHWCIAVSLAACAISLYGWIAYTRYLVEIQAFQRPAGYPARWADGFRGAAAGGAAGERRHGSNSENPPRGIQCPQTAGARARRKQETKQEG